MKISTILSNFLVTVIASDGDISGPLQLFLNQWSG